MDNDPESHKNEGFLKSMWHNLTNHPAHQKPAEGDNNPGSSSKDSSAEEKNDDKKDEEARKSSSS
jgi:molecular chaperone DnaJ